MFQRTGPRDRQRRDSSSPPSKPLCKGSVGEGSSDACHSLATSSSRLTLPSGSSSLAIYVTSISGSQDSLPVPSEGLELPVDDAACVTSDIVKENQAGRARALGSDLYGILASVTARGNFIGGGGGKETNAGPKRNHRKDKDMFALLCLFCGGCSIPPAN